MLLPCPASRRLLLSSILAVTIVGACTRSQPEAAPDAGTPDAGIPTEVALHITATAELPDGGTYELVPPVAGERVSVDPFQSMLIQSNLPLTNERVRLFDEANRAVISDDEYLSTDGGTLLYRLRLPEPLKTGHRYELVVDAESGETLADSTGRAHPDISIEFEITGERQKPPPPEKPGRRRRR